MFFLVQSLNVICQSSEVIVCAYLAVIVKDEDSCPACLIASVKNLGDLEFLLSHILCRFT